MSAKYQARVVFQEEPSGSEEYVLPIVQVISDPKEGIKATIISGTRGDGSIIIPGGKRSQEIRIKGLLMADNYADLTTAMNTLRISFTTDLATLTLEHRLGAGEWSTDWVYYIRRLEEISFPRSYRTGYQEYEITVLVLSY